MGLHGAESAIAHCSTVMPKAIAGRWLSIQFVEARLRRASGAASPWSVEDGFLPATLADAPLCGGQMAACMDVALVLTEEEATALSAAAMLPLEAGAAGAGAAAGAPDAELRL